MQNGNQALAHCRVRRVVAALALVHLLSCSAPHVQSYQEGDASTVQGGDPSVAITVMPPQEKPDASLPVAEDDAGTQPPMPQCVQLDAGTSTEALVKAPVAVFYPQARCNGQCGGFVDGGTCDCDATRCELNGNCCLDVYEGCAWPKSCGKDWPGFRRYVSRSQALWSYSHLYRTPSGELYDGWAGMTSSTGFSSEQMKKIGGFGPHDVQLTPQLALDYSQSLNEKAATAQVRAYWSDDAFHRLAMFDGASPKAQEPKALLFESEFKYISWSNKDSSGSITFFAVAPRQTSLGNRIAVLVKLHAQGQTLTYSRAIDFSAITYERTSQSNRIKAFRLGQFAYLGYELNGDRERVLHVAVADTQLKLDLKVPIEQQWFNRLFTAVALDQQEEIAGAKMDAFTWWRPVLFHATATGSMETRVGGQTKVYNLNGATVYHDQNATVANPRNNQAQYIWFHGDVTHNQTRMAVTFLGFAHNTCEKPINLYIREGGQTYTYSQDELFFEATTFSNAKRHLNRITDATGDVVVSDESRVLDGGTSTHQTLTAFVLRTNDGRFEIKGESTFVDAAGLASIWPLPFASLDESILSVTVNDKRCETQKVYSGKGAMQFLTREKPSFTTLGKN